MTKLYYLAPYVVTIGMTKDKHPQKLNRRNRGRKARATRTPMIGPTPKFPQPPWAISMIPKPSFAKKKQRTKVLREIRNDPTSSALEAAKRNIAEPESDDAVECPSFNNTDNFLCKPTVEPTSFPSDNSFWAPQFGNDDKSVSTDFTVKTVTTAETVTQTVDDDI